MTKLLVSVRNAAEAKAALDGGADLIDIKEPLHGSLGAADPLQWEEVCRAVGNQRPLSVALGELHEAQCPKLARKTDGVQFAKIGLARCGNAPDWPSRWLTAMSLLPREVTRVAVCYADWKHAEAPSPEEVLHYAAEYNCGAFLFDTYDKTRGKLLDHLTAEQLSSLLETAQRHGMLSVLGGSLGIDQIADVLELEPDYIAVRGAACPGERTGSVCRSLVKELAMRIAISWQS